MRRRVAILISGRGSNMAALVKAAGAEDFPAEIAVVISNRADAPGLEKASRSVTIAPRSRRRCKLCWTVTESI
jgi:phosphoribosylglycinamide formyltransferase-1